MPEAHPLPIRNRALRPAAWIACAAILLIQACFQATGEGNPYNVPDGEFFENIQLEAAPDGSILILARVAMRYRHEDPESPWAGSSRVRNQQTILYRRAGGTWTATSFKNIQYGYNRFPVLVPVPGMGFQALVVEKGTVKRFTLRDGAWQRLPDPLMPLNMYYRYLGDYRNWDRFSLVAMPDDSSVVVIDRKWDAVGDSMVLEAREPGGKTVRFDPTFNPLAFHADARFRAVAGTERRLDSVADGVPYYSTHLVQYFWNLKDLGYERNHLEKVLNTLMDACYAPYKDGTGLFVGSPEGYLVYPLSPEGSAEDNITWPRLYGSPMSSLVFAGDDQGCIHSLDQVYGLAKDTVLLEHRNSCLWGPMDTLALPTRVGMEISEHRSLRFRIGPQGQFLAAWVIGGAAVVEGTEESQRTNRLVFAELRDGKWVLETVQQR